MKILIVSIFPKYSAIWRYAHYLKKYLSKKNNVTFLDLWKDKKYHSNSYRALSLIKGIKLPDCDVLILVAPLLCNSLLKSNAKLKVTIFHDNYAKSNGLLPVRMVVKATYKNLKYSDLILPVSNFSKQEIIDTYGLKDKLHMIHGAISHDVFKLINLKRDNNLLLHIGREDERKNFRFIIELMKKIPNSKLLKVGTISKNDTMHTLGLNIEQIENVTDKELADIYNKAGILLFPSLNEGLGFPPLEAYSCALPVIAANNSGLRESCIKESLIELDLDLWVKKIKKIQTDKKYRDKMIKKGLRHSKKFDWKLYVTQVENLITQSISI